MAVKQPAGPMMQWSRRLLAAAISCALLISAGCSARRDGQAAWRSCADGWECRELEVPLDYAQPGGPSITLTVTRRLAPDPRQRLGTLIINPGGPGAAAIEFVHASLGFLSPAVRDRFDLVAFDPRGVGRSTPIECGGTVDDLFRGNDLTPDDARELDALAAAGARFATRCASGASRDLLGHVDAATIARDMDSVRATLGTDKINYLGFSWGTLLGAWYAELFPARVRAMVLDGAVDPALPLESSLLDQARGFEQSLNAFFADCAARPQCAFHSSGNPAQAYDRLAARVDREPLNSGGGTSVGPAEFDIAVGSYLYGGKATWPALAQALRAAEDGDGSALRSVYVDYAGITSSGDDGSYASYLALTCGDSARVGDTAAYAAAAVRIAGSAPRFGPSTVYLGIPCATWPVTGPNAPRALRAQGAPPILVIGSTGDPATPIVWARSMADALDAGVLVTTNASSHTALGRSACADQAAESYLLTLQTPVELNCADAE